MLVWILFWPFKNYNKTENKTLKTKYKKELMEESTGRGYRTKDE
jgi:hypothetical protein